MRRTTLLIALALPLAAALAPGRTAHAQKASWDRNGWVLLGQKAVNGKRDVDMIPVARKEGRFTKLMVVVEDSDLEMRDMEVTLGNGQKVSPDVKQFFRGNERTRAIDLPGEARFIKKVVFHYGNLPGGGRATVQVWAKEGGPEAGGGAPGPGAPSPGPGGGPARWDSAGWTKLGERIVQGKRDQDVIPVKHADGPFTKLMMVVEDSDLELNQIEVTFGNNEKFTPEVKHLFREGDRTRAIDLPGAQRNIRVVKIRYGNLPGGGKARVEIWGKNEPGGPAAGPPPGGPPPFVPPGRGGAPIVTDFWPRQGPGGTTVTVLGRRFSPDTQIGFGSQTVAPKVRDPFTLTFVVPQGNGEQPIVIHRPGRRDVFIGAFKVGGKAADERAQLRMRWHTDAERWWKARQRELAKTEAEREAALQKEEAQLAADREKRRQERLAKIRAAWQADFLRQDDVRAELALHADRSARLARMLRLAETGEFAPLAVRIRILVDMEDARHERRMNDLKVALARR